MTDQLTLIAQNPTTGVSLFSDQKATLYLTNGKGQTEKYPYTERTINALSTKYEMRGTQPTADDYDDLLSELYGPSEPKHGKEREK